jgi:hypothetical protein
MTDEHETHKKISWNKENENIMIEWCDIAKCYHWMHMRSNAKYAKYNMWFTIPSIVLSTISGTASFAQGSMTGMAREYAPMAIGTVNITVGIINTIQQFFKLSQMQEAHRVAYIAWDKFARNIKIELSKKPDERTEAALFFKQSRHEYDRLMESSPTIPNLVIREFIKEISGAPGTDQAREYADLIKPEICNIIKTSKHSIYRNSFSIIRGDKIPYPTSSVAAAPPSPSPPDISNNTIDMAISMGVAAAAAAASAAVQNKV